MESREIRTKGTTAGFDQCMRRLRYILLESGSRRSGDQRGTVAIVLCLFFLLALPTVAAAQPEESNYPRRDLTHQYAQSIGGQVILTNSGFGLGGHLRKALRGLSITAEISLGAGKDAREVAFFDRFGRRDVLNKANYLLMVPMHIGFERRLFADRIEDDFRPFILLIGGPTLGWEYPYFKDANQNGLLDLDEKTYDAISGLPGGRLKPGIGGTIAIGAHFGRSRGMTQGVRIGYSFTRFPGGIRLLEDGIKEPQSFFGTPSIVVYFGRLN
jgi:hypothetical protein